MRSPLGPSSLVPSPFNYVEYALARFDTLTLADVEIFGVTADEFTRWQIAYRRPELTPYPAPPPTSNVPTSQLTTFASPPSETGNLPPPLPATALPSPRVANASVSDTPVSGFPPPVSTASSPDLLKPLENVRVDHLLARAGEVTKALLTPGRIALTLGWAIALRLANDRYFWMSDFSFLAMFALAGVPWLAFRVRDAIAAKTRFNAKEALLLFLAGAYLSLLAARLTLSLLATLRYSIR